MDNELKQMLVQILEGQEAIKLDVKDLKTDVKELKEDVGYLKKEVSILGAKIDGEINQGRIADRCMLQDIKLSVDVLNSNQRKQENKIIELDMKIAK